MTSTEQRRKWADMFRRMRTRVLAEGSANALRVYVALESFAGYEDGYAFPTVETLRRRTPIKSQHTVFAALKQLESLGIIYRRKLISKKRGWEAPNLYRIGCPIDTLPARASEIYILPPHVQSPRPERAGSG